mmetsp:Transcript_19491/g.48854  ORF Transcript_19491/g.48854 Transcript_19491/m.48854 type:complete len:414 (+) Transcript_19491:1311-2552(+)
MSGDRISVSLIRDPRLAAPHRMHTICRVRPWLFLWKSSLHQPRSKQKGGTVPPSRHRGQGTAGSGSGRLRRTKTLCVCPLLHVFMGGAGMEAAPDLCARSCSSYLRSITRRLPLAKVAGLLSLALTHAEQTICCDIWSNSASALPFFSSFMEEDLCSTRLLVSCSALPSLTSSATLSPCPGGLPLHPCSSFITSGARSSWMAPSGLTSSTLHAPFPSKSSIPSGHHLSKAGCPSACGIAYDLVSTTTSLVAQATSLRRCSVNWFLATESSSSRMHTLHLSSNVSLSVTSVKTVTSGPMYSTSPSTTSAALARALAASSSRIILIRRPATVSSKPLVRTCEPITSTCTGSLMSLSEASDCFSVRSCGSPGKNLLTASSSSKTRAIMPCVEARNRSHVPETLSLTQKSCSIVPLR